MPSSAMTQRPARDGTSVKLTLADSTTYANGVQYQVLRVQA